MFSTINLKIAAFSQIYTKRISISCPAELKWKDIVFYSIPFVWWHSFTACMQDKLSTCNIIMLTCDFFNSTCNMIILTCNILIWTCDFNYVAFLDVNKSHVDIIGWGGVGVIQDTKYMCFLRVLFICEYQQYFKCRDTEHGVVFCIMLHVCLVICSLSLLPAVIYNKVYNAISKSNMIKKRIPSV